MSVSRDLKERHEPPTCLSPSDKATHVAIKNDRGHPKCWRNPETREATKDGGGAEN